MTVVEQLQEAVKQLSTEELKEFCTWWETFQESLWDQQIAEDFQAGRLDHLIAEAEAEFEAGRYQEL
jgi:hypothetical protein